MAYSSEILTVPTKGRGSYALDGDVHRIIHGFQFGSGLLNVFCHHTSASLMICENADTAVRRDLERFMADLVPDGDTRFQHRSEGPDDMPAHIRSILTQHEITVPVNHGKLQLGTWQSIFLWEHRTASQQRKVTVSMQGEFVID